MYALVLVALLGLTTGRIQHDNQPVNDLGACIYVALLLHQESSRSIPSLDEIATHHPLLHAESGTLQDAIKVLNQYGFNARTCQYTPGTIPDAIGISIAALNDNTFCVIQRISPTDGYVFIPGATPLNFLAFDATRIQGPGITNASQAVPPNSLTFWVIGVLGILIFFGIVFGVLRRHE